MRTTYLPFALPDIDEAELEEIRESLFSGWLTTGPKTRQFETIFAEAVGARYAVAVNSCTAAMHLALEALGLGPGDEVITTPYTFAASAEVVRYFDARPIFVDVDPVSLNIDPAWIEEAVTDCERRLSSWPYRSLCASRKEYACRVFAIHNPFQLLIRKQRQIQLRGQRRALPASALLEPPDGRA